MAVYGGSTVKVEPFGIEHIPGEERHGTPKRLLTLWFASNVTIGSFAVGYLAVSAFQLPVYSAFLSFLIANVIGGILLGLVSAEGPSFGYPQMVISRATFGRRGAYLPAALQWASTVGWFTVNAVLGAFALNALTHIGYLPSAVVLLATMVVAGIYGHNFIHQLERVMTVILGIFFAIVTFILLSKYNALLHYHASVLPGSYYFYPSFILLTGASLSYLMSWAPYASDYSRYLGENTPVSRSFLYTLVGGAAASFWFEALGALVAAYIYGNVHGAAGVSITSSISVVLGPLGSAGLLAIVLGTLAANALNIYTGALSFLVLDIRLKRWMAVLLGGIIGGTFTLLVAGTFTSFYEGFLLLLDYWVTPWIAIVVVDFYIFGRRGPEYVRKAPSIGIAALISYITGLLCSIPFISWSYANLSYTGYISSHFLRGADISYYVAFLVTFLLYYFIARRRITPLPSGYASGSG